VVSINEKYPVDYPFGEPVRLDVHPAHTECRRKPGLTRIRLPHGDDAWLVTRHEDIRTMLRDRRFSRAACLEYDEARFSPQPVKTSVLGMDGSDHTRLRRLIASGLSFSERHITRLRPTAVAMAERLIDKMIDCGPPTDLDEHFAVPLAGEITCELLGIPFADRANFLGWLEAYVSTTMPADEVESRIEEISTYMTRLMTVRQAAPADDLISFLVQAKDNDNLLSEPELIEVVNDLLLAGYYNTSAQLLNVIYLVLAHPEQTRLLHEEPELIPRAVDECLRCIPFPNHATFARYATEDVELGGTLIRKGEAVMPALPSGNRDETVFDNAGKLDFRRTKNPHLSFGYGLHHCLGPPLVRMIMQIALSALLTRLPDLSLAVTESELRWHTDLELRRVYELPATWQVT
jgi:cytochrome P450